LSPIENGERFPSVKRDNLIFRLFVLLLQCHSCEGRNPEIKGK